MIKTTVYLPENLEFELDQSAAIAGVSKAEAIRRAIASWVAQTNTKARPPRKLPVFTSGRPLTVEEMDRDIVDYIAERAARR